MLQHLFQEFLDLQGRLVLAPAAMLEALLQLDNGVPGAVELRLLPVA